MRVAVALDDAARRAARALDAADADSRSSPRALGSGRLGPGGRAGASSSVERLQELERALLEPRLDVALGALADARARSRRRRAGARSRARPRARPAARAAGPVAPRRRRRRR